MLLHAAAAQLNQGHDAACWGSSSVLACYQSVLKSLQCVCLLLEASQMREHMHLNACHQSVHMSPCLSLYVPIYACQHSVP